MKKRFLTVALSLVMGFGVAASLASCGEAGEDKGELTLPEYENIEAPDYSDVVIPEDFKFGLICLHDETSTYDKNFIDAAKRADNEMGLKSDQDRKSVV